MFFFPLSQLHRPIHHLKVFSESFDKLKIKQQQVFDNLMPCFECLLCPISFLLIKNFYHKQTRPDGFTTVTELFVEK